MRPDLDELETKARAATAGPWTAWHGDDSYAMNCYGVTRQGAPDEEFVFAPQMKDWFICLTGLQEPRYVSPPVGRWHEVWANTEYIAAASPCVMLALIERVRYLERELDAAYDLVREAERVAGGTDDTP